MMKGAKLSQAGWVSKRETLWQRLMKSIHLKLIVDSCCATAHFIWLAVNNLGQPSCLSGQHLAWWGDLAGSQVPTKASLSLLSLDWT